MTQTDAIRNHFKVYEYITTKEAFIKYGCTRLADVVYRLRRPPYNMNIKSKEVNEKNRYGGMSRFSKYYLEK